MQGIDNKLMGGVVNQVKPFAGIISTSGTILQQHTETVKTNTETVIEQDEILKKTTFNMGKFKDELKSGGNKFNEGVKELTGGLIDIGGTSETISKKFKAIGDIGRGIASPITSLFSSFEEKEDDKDKKKDDKDKAGLDDLVDPKALKKKKKLDKENNKQTDKQNKNLKKSGKGFKVMLRGMMMASLKFLAIGAVVALLIVGFLKLISALSDNGGLQSVFDFISNIMGRVKNAFDATILGLNKALSYVGLDFLDKDEVEEKEQGMRDRTAQRSFKKQRADDAKEVAAIKEQKLKEDPTLKGSALDAAVDTEAMKRGLITDRMVLANAEERAAGKKGVLIRQGDSYEMAGQATNDAFIGQLSKETGNDEYREKLIEDNATDPEAAKKSLEKRNAESAELVRALTMIDAGDKERIQELIDRQEKNREDRITNVLMGRKGMSRAEAEAQYASESGGERLADLKTQMAVVDSTLANFKAVTGDDAETVYKNMRGGHDSDEYDPNKTGEELEDAQYYMFEHRRFKREFNEYARQNENVATIDADQSYQFQDRLSGASIRGQAKTIQELRDSGATEKEIAEMAKQNPSLANVANVINEGATNVQTSSGSDGTSNMDIKDN
tara:strand:+ start:18142 stop:19983 length:1842 start_codon:yes stop_codon:yes gene_type:complete